MIDRTKYDTNLAMGLGLIDETKVLLEIWSPPLGAVDLYEKVLGSGMLRNVSAYRLRNIVVRCFGSRYLASVGPPALYLKTLLPFLSSSEIRQLFFIYSCRANVILADFVTNIYWKKYEAAGAIISRDDAEGFIRRAIDDGKTPSRWAEGQIKRVGRYLIGCCADFGLLAKRTSTGRHINSYRIESKVAAYLAYDLHNSGVGDNALLAHEDWRLFGFAREDVLEEIKQLSLRGLLIVQAAGGMIKISWKQKDMKAFCDVITQS
jgi:hypothetical protein